MNAIQKLAYKFVQSHWDDINKDKTEVIMSKSKVLRAIRSTEWYGGWIVCEVMSWGCNIDYRAQYEVDYDGWLVLKIGRKYYQLGGGDGFTFTEVKPKYRKVIYFE